MQTKPKIIENIKLCYTFIYRLKLNTLNTFIFLFLKLIVFDNNNYF